MKDADEVFTRVGAYVGVAPTQLLQRNDADQKVANGRLLAAALLRELRGGSEGDEWVQRKLNCSPSHVALVKRLSMTDTDFRAKIAKIKGEELQKEEVQKPAEGDEKTSDEKSVEDLLFGYIERFYGINRRRLRIDQNRTKISEIRRTFALLANRLYKMEAEQIQQMLQCPIVDAKNMLHIAKREALRDVDFQREIIAICKKFDLPRQKVMPTCGKG